MVKIRIPKPRPHRSDLEAEISRLKQELEKEKSSTKQLRASIDVIQIGWDLDKQKLLEAITSLDNALIQKSQNIKKKNKSKPEVCTCKKVAEKIVEPVPENENKRNGRLLTCTLCCNKTYRSLELFQKHLHNVGENLVCPFCEKPMCLCTLKNHLEKGCDSTDNLFPLNCKGARRQVSSKEVETQTDSFLRLPDQDLYTNVSVKMVEILDKNGVRCVIPHITMEPLPHLKSNVQCIKKIIKPYSSFQTKVHKISAHDAATCAEPDNTFLSPTTIYKNNSSENEFCEQSRKKIKSDSIIEHSYAMKIVQENKNCDSAQVSQTILSDDNSPSKQFSKNTTNGSNSKEFEEDVSVNKNNDYETNCDIVEKSEKSLNSIRKYEKKGKPDRKLSSTEIVENKNHKDKVTVSAAMNPKVEENNMPLKLPSSESSKTLEEKESQANFEISPSLNTLKKISNESFSKISSSAEKTVPKNSKNKSNAVTTHKKNRKGRLSNVSDPSNSDQPASVSDSNAESCASTSNTSSKNSDDDFFCSACEVYFKSVAQHVNSHHAEEEVEVEPDSYKEVLKDLKKSLVCEAGVEITEKIKHMLLKIPKNTTGQKRKKAGKDRSTGETAEHNKKMKLDRMNSETKQSKKKYLNKEGESKTKNIGDENNEINPIEESSSIHIKMARKEKKNMLQSENDSEKLRSKKLDQVQEILKLDNANKFLNLPHCKVVLNDIGLKQSLVNLKSERDSEVPSSEDKNESINIKQQFTKVEIPSVTKCNIKVRDIKQMLEKNNEKYGHKSLVTDNIKVFDEQKQPSAEKNNLNKKLSTNNREVSCERKELSTDSGKIVNEMNDLMTVNTNKIEEIEKFPKVVKEEGNLSWYRNGNNSEKLRSKKLDQFQEILKLDNANKFLNLPHCKVVLNDIGLKHSLVKCKPERESEVPSSEDKNESINIKQQFTKVEIPSVTECNIKVRDIKQMLEKNNEKDEQKSLVTDNIEVFDDQKQPPAEKSNVTKELPTDNREVSCEHKELSTDSGKIVNKMNDLMTANTNKIEEIEKFPKVVKEEGNPSTDNNETVFEIIKPSVGNGKVDVEKISVTENCINMSDNESLTVGLEVVCENEISVLELTEEVHLVSPYTTEGAKDLEKSTEGTMLESEDHLENEKDELKKVPEEFEKRSIENQSSKERLVKEEDDFRGSDVQPGSPLDREQFKNETDQSESLTNTSGNGYKCNLCLNEFTSQRQAEKHILLHDNKDAFHCSYCSSVYPIKLLLKEHIRNEHGKNQGQS